MKSAEQKRGRFAAGALAALALLLVLSPVGRAQAASAGALLRVAVRDSGSKPVVDATVQLLLQPLNTADTKQTPSARTDGQGNCRFSDLRSGTYTVRVEKAGYVDSTLSLLLGANEARSIEVTLSPEKVTLPAAAPEFFDAPHFAVSDVTDTTSIGGHGSDAVVRTRESLAKDTVALGVSSATPPGESSYEKSLRDNAERAPASFAANRDFGRVLLAEGKAREALTYLERAANASHDGSQPDQPRADLAELHHLLAQAHERLGDSLSAVREYQQAAELDPCEGNLFDWGSELLLHHAPEPAVEVFSKGNRLFPQSARMLLGLGAAWFASGSFDRAVEFVSQASDRNSADPVPYKFLATMQSTQTLTSDEVVVRLRRFAALYPQNAAANYYFAVGLWKQRKNSPVASDDSALVTQVESLLQTALRLEPAFGAAYLQLGVLQAEQKDVSQAVADYQRALQAKPSLPELKMTDVQVEETHYRLAQAYREMGETDKAKAELQLYDRVTRESAEQTARQRREIGQFVYSLRDQAAPAH